MFLGHEVGVSVVQGQQGVDEPLARADRRGRRDPRLLQVGDDALGLTLDLGMGRKVMIRRLLALRKRRTGIALKWL